MPTIVRSQEPAIQITSCNGEVQDQGFLLGDSVDNLVTCDGGGVYIVPEHPLTSCLPLQKVVDESSSAGSLSHYERLLMSIQGNKNSLQSTERKAVSFQERNFTLRANLFF